MLEKHLSGYDETAHVPSRNDAASKLAPPAPVPEITEPNKVRRMHLLSCSLLLELAHLLMVKPFSDNSAASVIVDDTNDQPTKVPN